MRDIPVPTVRLSQGSLTFALGNSGVSYRGVLHRDTRVIEGKWSQGGVVSPLSLTKADQAG